MIAAFSACSSPHAEAQRASSLPLALPQVETTTLDSRATDLAHVLAGRPALVSLWASWCEACADEFAALNRLDAYAQEHGAVVVAIAEGDSVEIAAGIVQKRALKYTQLVDHDFKFADALGERRVPTTLVVDRDGRIVYEGGAFDSHALDAFRSVVEQARPSQAASR